MTASDEQPADASGAVERSLRLLRFIAEGGSTRNISEAARRIGANRVTLMRLIAVLEQAGMLVADAAGHRLGMPFLTLASAALGSSSLIARAREVLPGSRGIDAYVGLSRRAEGHEIVYWLAETPDTPLVSQSREAAVCLHTARRPVSRCSPCSMPRKSRQCASRPGKRRTRPRSKTCGRGSSGSRPTAARGAGRASKRGIDSCAAPTVSADGRVLAALSVAVPSQMFSHESERSRIVADRVISAAQQISRLVM